MRTLLTFLFCFLGFGLFGQVSKDALFNNLPSEGKYCLINKGFFKPSLHFKRQKWLKKDKIGDSLQLGCSAFEVNGVPIEFMIEIGKKRKKEVSMYMFAIKRSNYREDEEIINALDYYCYYGQNNYYFLSKEYILFTYAISGDDFARNNIKLMMKIENQLVKNLNDLH